MVENIKTSGSINFNVSAPQPYSWDSEEQRHLGSADINYMRDIFRCVWICLDTLISLDIFWALEGYIDIYIKYLDREISMQISA